MDKTEFLSILRENLEGYVPMEEVEKNIAFYRDYFKEASRPEKEVIEELGDPRLIAHTIIDAYKASKGPMADYYAEQARSEYSKEHSGKYEEAGEKLREKAEGFADRVLGWLAVIFVLAVFLVIFMTVIGMLGLFIRYVLPVILLIVIIKILVEYFRR